ncbi:MAG: TetR/AcrR family transcriptional regulator [Bacteroidota bacterium]
MKRSTRNAAKTKQEIIEKSAAVFNVHGYAGTKMQMLVDATGFQMGGIYRHFGTKMELAKAAFQYNYQILIKSNFEVEPQLNPQEKLSTIFQNYKRMALKPTIPGGCPILNTAIEVDDTDEAFRQLAKTAYEDVVSMIAKLLEEGKAQGFFKPEIDSQKEAQFVFASIEGAIMVSTISRDREAFVNIFDRTQSYLEGKVFL